VRVEIWGSLLLTLSQQSGLQNSVLICSVQIVFLFFALGVEGEGPSCCNENVSFSLGVLWQGFLFGIKLLFIWVCRCPIHCYCCEYTIGNIAIWVVSQCYMCLVILWVCNRQMVPSGYFTLFGFPSGPIKVIEIIVLQLLQCIFVLLKKLSGLPLFSYCSELNVMNLYFIVTKYLLFWDFAFFCQLGTQCRTVEVF
jgi:hypothetical protein